MYVIKYQGDGKEESLPWEDCNHNKLVKTGNREEHVLVLWEGFEAQDCLSAIKQLFIGSPLWRCLCSLAQCMMYV